MLPFSAQLRPGEPVADQVVFAATRAIVMGQLRPGDRFPSVRTLSRELKLNPNTAHRVIAMLTERGLIEVQVGVGTVVATLRPGSTTEKRALLGGAVERLVVDARQLGVPLDDVVNAVRSGWARTAPRDSKE